jgi:phosphoglycerol transferase MdoB-like AlkP superfamily enzyme
MAEGLGILFYNIYLAVKNADKFLLLIHLGVICLIALIVIVLFIFRENGKSEKERDGKKLSNFFGGIIGFLGAWLFAIFIGCIIDGAIILIAAFIVGTQAGAWPRWIALFYILPLFGVISLWISLFFLLVSWKHSKNRHDMDLPW